MWKVFLIQHKKGSYWSYPKGKPEDGEAPKESAVRELKEETNLSVEQFLELDPLVEQYSFMRDEMMIDKTVTYFLAIVSGALLLQPDEILDGRWVPLGEAEKLITFEESKRICKKLKNDAFFDRSR